MNPHGAVTCAGSQSATYGSTVENDFGGQYRPGRFPHASAHERHVVMDKDVASAMVGVLTGVATAGNRAVAPRSFRAKGQAGFRETMVTDLISVRLGTNDIERSAAFYDAVFGALGLGITRSPVPSVLHYRLPGGLNFIVAPPRNGEPARAANGDTMVFVATDAAVVDAWYADGLAAGGTCEGPPGPREPAGGRHGAYLRDPDGHKLGIYAP